MYKKLERLVDQNIEYLKNKTKHLSKEKQYNDIINHKKEFLDNLKLSKDEYNYLDNNFERIVNKHYKLKKDNNDKIKHKGIFYLFASIYGFFKGLLK